MPSVRNKPNSNPRSGKRAPILRPARGRSTPRVQTVTEQIRKYILDGGLAAGGILPSEGELSGLLGVSRTVIRESLRILQAQGLVEISHGRRPRVKPVDAQAAIQSLEAMFHRVEGSLDSLLEVRRALESEIAVLAVQRATPEHLEAMQAAIEQLRSAKGLEASVEADVLFHRCLADSTGNQLFGLLLETITGVLHETVARTLPQSGNQPAIDGHEQILRAIRNRDARAARAAVIAHLEWSEQDYAAK